MNEDLLQDSLEHHGILGQKWGVRRYQNPDGSLTAAGKKRLGSGKASKPKTPVEKWKANKLASIDKIYSKTYKHLDKAAAENPDDESIKSYRETIEKQHKSDRAEIENMTYMDVENAKKTAKIERREKVAKTVSAAGNAAMWSAKMALIGVRIGGTAVALNVIGDMGRTAMDWLSSDDGQATVAAGANIIQKVGNFELFGISAFKQKVSDLMPGSSLDKSLSSIDLGGLKQGDNYIPPEVLSAKVSTVTDQIDKINKKL